MRKKIIVGNWKMNKTLSESLDFVEILKENLINIENIDIGICPTNVCLSDVKNVLQESNIKVGAQNVYYVDKGAFTGEISVPMLKDINVDYCIVGHSERRQFFNETDENINLKMKRLLEESIIPIVCVGESLSERENDEQFKLVKMQIEKAFCGISEQDAKNIVVAYEPIWAIGTGITATDEQAEEMCKYIRDVLGEIYNEEIANDIIIQYGGSVNMSNAQSLLSMPNIDGALIGGASLKPEFIDIIKCVSKEK